MIVTIRVTQDDIDRGVPCGASSCPVALALLKIVAPNVGVAVDAYHIGLWCTPSHGDPFSPVRTPDVVVPFVRAFDTAVSDTDYYREVVRPFSFQLDIPERYLPGVPQGWEYAEGFTVVPTLSADADEIEDNDDEAL